MIHARVILIPVRKKKREKKRREPASRPSPPYSVFIYKTGPDRREHLGTFLHGKNKRSNWPRRHPRVGFPCIWIKTLHISPCQGAGYVILLARKQIMFIQERIHSNRRGPLCARVYTSEDITGMRGTDIHLQSGRWCVSQGRWSTPRLHENEIGISPHRVGRIRDDRPGVDALRNG